MISSLKSTVVQLEWRANDQRSVAGWWERKVWQSRNPNTIHRSRVSSDRYSQGMVSVWAGFNSCDGLETRESIWAARHWSADKLRRGYTLVSDSRAWVRVLVCGTNSSASFFNGGSYSMTI